MRFMPFTNMHKYSSGLTSHMYLLLFTGHFPNRIIRWVTIDKMHIYSSGQMYPGYYFIFVTLSGPTKNEIADDVNMLMEAHKNICTSRERNPGLCGGKVLFNKRKSWIVT